MATLSHHCRSHANRGTSKRAVSCLKNIHNLFSTAIVKVPHVDPVWITNQSGCVSLAERCQTGRRPLHRQDWIFIILNKENKQSPTSFKVFIDIEFTFHSTVWIPVGVIAAAVFTLQWKDWSQLCWFRLTVLCNLGFIGDFFLPLILPCVEC